MKRKKARKWIKALKSGKYEQGLGCMKRDRDGRVTHCPLGVLCELAIKDGVDVKTDRYTTAYCSEQNVHVHTFDGNADVLPGKVVEWAGLCSCNGTVFSRLSPVSLIELNDELKWSFKDIAGYIDDKWEVM